MLFPLILRMLIYIFLLVNIIVVSYSLCGSIYNFSGRFYHLGWPQPLGFHYIYLTNVVPFLAQGLLYKFMLGSYFSLDSL